jgi:hypothetical protein
MPMSAKFDAGLTGNLTLRVYIKNDVASPWISA